MIKNMINESNLIGEPVYIELLKNLKRNDL